MSYILKVRPIKLIQNSLKSFCRIPTRI